MDVRDRMEEIGNAKAANNGVWVEDGKSLIRDYISEEEIVKKKRIYKKKTEPHIVHPKVKTKKK